MVFIRCKINVTFRIIAMSLLYKQCIINKNASHKNKKQTIIDKVEIRTIVLSKEDSYDKKGSFKYFIGYIDEGDAFPVLLCIKISQMNRYVKYFSDNKCMDLLVHDKGFFKKIQ